MSSIEIRGLPDVCTNSPLRGKAFCQVHCSVAEKSGIPIGLREFLQHCNDPVGDSVKSGLCISSLKSLIISHAVTIEQMCALLVINL